VTAAIVNHLWQSTAVVVAAALVALLLRQNRASARHAVWLAASVKFLVPFGLLVGLGASFPWRAPAQPAAIVAPAVADAVQTFVEPFPQPAFTAAPVADAPRSAPMPWGLVLAGLWACGCAVVIIARVRGWRSVRGALGASTPVTLPDVEPGLPVRATPGLLEPGVVGIWRPVLLVPAGIETTLTGAQLRAVVAHELHHVRRRDNLTSAVHMVVEAAFWFHPLVWWVGARLVEERERACDEHVIASGEAPDAYAEGILNVCKRYVESPVACVSGVSGADLKRRIAAIMSRRAGLRLTLVRKAALAAAGTMAVGLPIVAGLLMAPPRAAAFAQGGEQMPKFDAASVRPCAPDAPSVPSRSGAAGQASPGYLNLSCVTLRSLVNLAYTQDLLNKPYGPGGAPGAPELVRGGPSWAYAEKFTIEARSEGSSDRDTLTGPMLRSLLEDRFKLKTHRATEQQPMYALTVAKSGLKIKLTPPGGCREFVPGQPPPAHDKDIPLCGLLGGTWGSYEAYGLTIGNLTAHRGRSFVDELFFMLRRMVIDRTGLEGRYNFTLNFTPDETIFQALEQQLGLTLEPVKAPAEYIVIDSAERPDSADASASASSGRAASPVPVASQSKVPTSPRRFDVASVRPCENAPAGRRAGGGSGGGGGPALSPGRLYLPCRNLRMLIEQAYILNAAPDGNPAGSFANWPSLSLNNADSAGRIRGGPSWMSDARYTIEATASGVMPSEQGSLMLGPMLRALLEDRFQLRVHQATETAPMYAMTVAKGGLKVAPMKDGACATERSGPPVSQRQAATDHVLPNCFYNLSGPDGPNWREELTGESLASFASSLSMSLGIKVIDRTGTADKFLFMLLYAPDDRTPMARRAVDAANGGSRIPPTAPDFFTALKEQLGLQLEAITGTRAYLVVDHVERPRPDDPGVASALPARAQGAGR